MTNAFQDLLLVEPDPVSRARLGRAMERHGLVTIAGSFEAGRRWLEVLGFRLVVANARLGDYNGINLALYADWHATRVVYSAFHDVPLAREVQAAGAFYELLPTLPAVLPAYLAGRVPDRDRRDPTQPRASRGPGRRASDPRAFAGAVATVIPGGRLSALRRGVVPSARALARVLVVDADVSTRVCLARMLEQFGYAVNIAPDAESALALMQSAPADVAVCDIGTAGHEGSGLIDQIQARFPSTAIIVATGQRDLDPRLTLRPGVIAWLTKPFEADRVRAAMREAVDAVRVLPTTSPSPLRLVPPTRQTST